MKKLMTILVLFAMCGVAMAAGVTGNSSAAKPHSSIRVRGELRIGLTVISKFEANIL